MMEKKTGSLTPGKQADIVLIRASDLNIFPSLPQGDPVHTVVMNTETANIDTVLIAGKVMKRHGKLCFPEQQIRDLKTRLLAIRERVMKAGNYVYQPAPQGARP